MEDNSSATHRVFFRVVESVEPYKFTQMTAFYVMVANRLVLARSLYQDMHGSKKKNTKQKTSSAACWTEV